MNILFLSELFYPHGGGAELATYLYAELLAQKGFNVIVVTNKFDKESEFSINGRLIVYRLPLFKGSGGIKYLILKRLDVLASSFIRKMMKWADVIYVPRFWFSAIPLAKIYRKPVITHLHDYIPICPLATIFNVSKFIVCNQRNSICFKCVYIHERIQQRSLNDSLTSILLNSTFKYYAQCILNLSDAIVCVSKAQATTIAKNSSQLGAKIEIIYNPVPEIPYIPLEGSSFAYFGGASVIKGFYVLQNALRTITNYKVHLLATGFTSLQNRLLRLSGNVTLEKYERVKGEEIEKIYKSSKAIIIPSICPEPLPYVVYEALLRGRFIIASRIGGIPEQIDNYSGCFLFQPGNYKELADIIESVSSIDRNDVIDIGLRNRDAFLNKKHNERSLNSFIRVIENVIAWS